MPRPRGLYEESGNYFDALGIQPCLGRFFHASDELSHVVYQASPRDPLVLCGVVAVMLLLGVVAVWIPAQRALAADPLLLLREE